MMNITDKDTSYLIKLDDIDINYISNYQYDCAPPLWSSSSSRNWGDEFVEFKIMAERKESLSDSANTCDYTIGEVMYRCVICDRDIPTTYRQEHNRSSKHKIYLKIAEAVLQRIQGHTVEEDKYEIVKKSSDTYFCDACIVIVNNTDKIHHEATKNHQKAIQDDCHLNDLLNIYLNKDLDSVNWQPMQQITPKIKPISTSDKEFNSDCNKENVINKFPIYSYFNKDYDTKSIVKKIEMHAQNSLKAEDIDFGKSKAVQPVVVSHSFGPNDLSLDDNDNTMTEHQIRRRQRQRANKKKRMEYENKTANKQANDIVQMDPIPVNDEVMLEFNSSMFQMLKAKKYLFDLPNVSNGEQSINNSISALNNRPNPFDVTNAKVNTNKSIIQSIVTNNGVHVKQGSTDKQMDPIDNQKKVSTNGKKTIENLIPVFDTQHKSADETESFDSIMNGMQVSISDHSNLIDNPNNEIYGTQISIDDDCNSSDEYYSSDELLTGDDKHDMLSDENNTDVESNKTDEQSLIMDQNGQNNETTKPNCFLNMDNVITKNKKQSVLSRSELEKYFEVITSSKYEFRPIHKLKCMNEDYIEIQTLDQTIVTVKADNFNGFHQRDGRLQCRVCMVMVDEEPANHIYNVDHIANVRIPLEDIHCFREIKEPYKHCVHCNDTFCNYDVHKLLQAHITAINDAMNKPDKPTETKMAARTFCETCNLFIDSHNFNSHVNGKPHKKLSLSIAKETMNATDNTNEVPVTGKVYCDHCMVYVVKANFDAHAKKHLNTVIINTNLNSNDIDKVYCEPCKMKVPKEMFIGHLYGKNHKTLVKVINESNKVNFCVTCDLRIDSLTIHMSGDYHQYHSNKKNFYKSSTEVTKTKPEKKMLYPIQLVDGKPICRICNVIVTNNASNIAEHTQGQVHQANYNVLLDDNRVEKVDNKLYCNICKITVEDTEELDHFESKTHKTALNTYGPDKTFCEKCKMYVLPANMIIHLSKECHTNATHNEEENNVQVNQIPKNSNSKNVSNYQIMITETGTTCKVCKVKIPSNPENITQHINGRAHKTKYKELLNANKIEIVNRKLVCDACKITVKTAEELNHITTERHKKALTESGIVNTSTGLYRCDYCEIDILNTPYSIKKHEEEFDHNLVKILKCFTNKIIHYHFERINGSTEIKCKICNITVPNQCSKIHLESARHNYKYRTTLTENEMVKSRTGFHCQYCSVDVKDKAELKHIELLSHLLKKQSACRSQDNLPAKSVGYHCPLCDVDVPNNPKNITVHDQGYVHVEKLRNLSVDDEEKALMTETSNGRQMFCILCRVVVPVTGTAQHVKGARHKANKIEATAKPKTT